VTRAGEVSGTLVPPERDLTADDLVARAAAMVPVLRERQQECEDLGRMPVATSDDLVAAGFYRILQPRRFGGYELDLGTFSRVTIELARGCPSTGWAYAFTAGHAHLLAALFPEQAQRDVHGTTGDVRMPGNIRPQRAEPVEGGYRVSGAWDYVSGCDSATHFLFSADAPAIEDGGEPRRLTCILDAGDCSIVDNWDVHGLRGTGSRRVIADDVFVPGHRTIGTLNSVDVRVYARTRDMPGRTVHANPMYAAGGLFSLLAGESAAVAVGIARGALDHYEQTLATRRTMIAPLVSMKDAPQYRRCYAEAVQQVDVAELALLGSDADYMEWARRDAEEGVAFSAEHEQRLIIRKMLCAKLCSDAVDLMVRTGGSSSLKRGDPMERCRRDMTTLMSHPTVQSETGTETFSQLHFDPSAG
jgi:3-hydroxy-9,10-secoandrosta-1,3,5(10)-triene-9,17-dione monooxygenase